MWNSLEIIIVLLWLPLVTFCSGEEHGNFSVEETGVNGDCWDIKSLYSGTINATTNGFVCQKWSSQKPNRHNYSWDRYFPTDGSSEAAENYCRDPLGIAKPWCFTTVPKKRWGYCTVPICNSNCTSDDYKCTRINGSSVCFIDNTTCGYDLCSNDPDCRRSSESLNLAVGIIVGTIVLFTLVASAWFIVLCCSSTKDQTDAEDEQTEEQIYQVKSSEYTSSQPTNSSQADSPQSNGDAAGQVTGESSQKKVLTKKQLKELKEQKLINTYLQELF